MKTNYLRWLAILAGMGLIAIALSRGMGYWQESLIQMDSPLRISMFIGNREKIRSNQ